MSEHRKLPGAATSRSSSTCRRSRSSSLDWRQVSSVIPYNPLAGGLLTGKHDRASAREAPFLHHDGGIEDRDGLLRRRFPGPMSCFFQSTV